MAVALPNKQEKACSLRAAGLTTTEIAKEIGVAKSTVSVWVRHIEVPPHYWTRLQARRRAAGQHANKVRTAIAAKQKEDAVTRGKTRAMSSDLLWLAGCMLYWGEGNKSTKHGIVALTNSCEQMLRVFKQFLLQSCQVSPTNLRAHVTCYTHTIPLNEIERYWQVTLDMSASNFIKSTVNKKPCSSAGARGNKLPYGICRLYVCNSELLYEILGAIDYFGSTLCTEQSPHAFVGGGPAALISGDSLNKNAMGANL